MSRPRKPHDGTGETPHTSYRLTATDHLILEALAEELGLNRTQTIRTAIRRMARSVGVPFPKAPMARDGAETFHPMVGPRARDGS